MAYIEDLKRLIERLRDLSLDFEISKIEDLEEFEQQRIPSSALKAREAKNNEIILEIGKRIQKLESELREISNTPSTSVSTTPSKRLADVEATIQEFVQELNETKPPPRNPQSAHEPGINPAPLSDDVNKIMERVAVLSLNQLRTILTVLTMNENRSIVGKKNVLIKDIQNILVTNPDAVTVTQTVMREFKM